jgi:uncharacterized integral membrane protein
MPFKLIGTILILILFSVFTGFNLVEANRCNVWLFHTFENVPVCLTILLSFTAGLIVMLPFTFHARNKKNKPVTPPETEQTN